MMVSKEKTALNAKMREIIRVIHKQGGAMSANEIQNHTGFSYATVKKYLAKLLEGGVVIIHGQG